MSGYGPGGSQIYTKPTPFPLDHDGECKHAMSSYLACIKKVKGVNEDQCRDLAKAYLSCRMDRNLMARDDFKNLGFQQQDEAPPTTGKAPPPAATRGQSSTATASTS